MSWARVGTIIPGKRVSITLDSTAGSGSANYQVTIPANLSDFWDTIDASGNELRVTGPDGSTVLTYDLSGFSKTNRTCTIRIGSHTVGSASMGHAFLYYDMAGVSTGAGSPATASPRSGYIDVGDVIAPIKLRHQRPGDTKPADVVSKDSGASDWVWIDLGHTLDGMFLASDGHKDWEEISYVTYTVEASGAAVSTMLDVTSMRVINGRYIRMILKAGTTGVDNTLILTAVTTYPNQQTGRTLVFRVLVKVLNVSET